MKGFKVGFKYLTILLTILLAGCGGSRDGTNTSPIARVNVEGEVLALDGSPLTGALVQDLQTAATTTTDEFGRFEILAGIDNSGAVALALTSDNSDGVVDFTVNVKEEESIKVTIRETNSEGFKADEPIVVGTSVKQEADPVAALTKLNIGSSDSSSSEQNEDKVSDKKADHEDDENQDSNHDSGDLADIEVEEDDPQGGGSNSEGGNTDISDADSSQDNNDSSDIDDPAEDFADTAEYNESENNSHDLVDDSDDSDDADDESLDGKDDTLINVTVELKNQGYGLGLGG